MAASIIIDNVAVVEVEAGTIREGCAVEIDELGLIAAITPQAQMSGETRDISRIDGRGKFLLPGLIDSHVHVAFNGLLDVRADFTRTLKQFLLHGVTTVVDFFTVGGDFPGSSPEAIRDDVNSGKFLGPYMLTSYGCLNAPGGFCDCSVGDAASAVATREDVDREIDRIAALNPNFMKIVYDDVFGTLPNLTKDLLRDLVTAAHERGFRTAVHVATGTQAIAAVEAGADILGHGIVDEIPDGLISEMLDCNVAMIPTLASYESRSRERSRMVLPAISPPEVVQYYAGMQNTFYELNGQLLLYRQAFDGSLRCMEEMVENGVTVVAGSDAGTWYTFPGDSLMRELELYVARGVASAEAIRMATCDAAALWGLSAETGSIAVGKRADLLMVSDNPLNDISAIRKVVAVVRGGRLINLDALALDIANGPILPSRPMDGSVPCSPHHLRDRFPKGT
ncbi:dipeptidase [Mycobacterium kiyosense]|uniref:Amidohydrolase-related domain-containing protein n=1 Tax=Mycobacterium gordonae TaxID=1778 RepID=A0A1X1VZ01_MYCGO|nr:MULTISPECIES: amidohydrolase family protein [Mycobacterium]MCV7007295.1 amidohydrolase family protein [Mycobacterium gordonae]ORV75528.1 hypothetical protein AWC08_33560 [Mycobacterium gordonae]PJE24221.1 MAG: hypothetical protein CK431_07200 [Mycobacterium sp.]GLD42926.1 dipeptidase [Mycobacterium kiyosense]